MYILTLVYCASCFNPIQFIKANKITKMNQTWGEYFRGDNAKVHVLSRSPNWKLMVKQARLLNDDDLLNQAEQTGRSEVVEGTAEIIECDVGYRVVTAENDFWAPNVSGGYVCGTSFYASPHPSRTQVVDIVGCVIVLFLGLAATGLILSPNIIDIVDRLKHRDEDDEQQNKISSYRWLAFTITSIFLFFVTFVAADLVMEKFDKPHVNRIVKENCYVIANYTDKFANLGDPDVVKNFRKELKRTQRAALNRKLMKRMAKGKIINNSRSWKLLQAGLLADVETPFVQQASMTDLGNNRFKFHVPCGAAITSVSTKEGVPQVSYQWYPKISYSTENVDMTFVEKAHSHKNIWCKGKSGQNLEKWKKENGYDYASQSDQMSWFVVCTKCTWSRQFGQCFFGFKYAPAGNFVLRRVINNTYGGKLKRGTANENGVLIWRTIDPNEASMSEPVMYNTYENRKGGWLENMSHTIMQNDWEGWDYTKRHEAMSHWRSAMIPSQNEGEVHAAMNGMRIARKMKKNIECNINMDLTASSRPSNDTCYTEFEMEVQPGTQWQETGEPCKRVYASKVGNMISVAVDTRDDPDAEKDDKYCSITLTIGTMEKMYYIRPGEPWVGYHLDAWRCQTTQDGTSGINCEPRRKPEAVNYTVFSGILPTVLEQTVHYEPEDGLFGDITEKLGTALALVLVVFVLVGGGVLLYKYYPKIKAKCDNRKKNKKSKNNNSSNEDSKATSVL